MSLVDALLNEAYREPREVWIAARTDGIKGTGTQSDPFNGSVLSSSPIDISVLKKDPLNPTIKAAATTSTDHGFSTGDMVTVSGVYVESYTKYPDTSYLGTFPVTVTGPQTFTYPWMSDVPVTSPAVPLAGGIECWRERERFDGIMRSLQPNTTIHLGPGVFETKGMEGDFNIVGWRAQSGQRILGSGMGITTLKVVGASAPYGHYCAIGTRALVEQYLQGFEASDFTIDCNVEGQLIPTTTCAAICFQGGGRHIRIRRVRAIRFGSRAPNDHYVENFVFFFGALNFSAPVLTDCVVEDCIAEQPSPNVYWNSLIFLAGAAFGTPSKYHVGSVFRNNYVNCEYVHGPLTPVDTFGYSSGTGLATVQTKGPHGHSPGGRVSVRGVLVNGSTESAFNGVFLIEQVVTAMQLTYRPYPADSPTSTGLGINAETVIGAPMSSHFLALATDANGYKIQRVGAQPSKIFKVTTILPHNLTLNSVVKVGGVVVNGLPTNDPANTFNGAFPVTAVHSRREFEYTLEKTPPADPLTFGFIGDPALGEGHHVFSVDGGTGAVMEGNRSLHCADVGPWDDTVSSRDWVARNNFYHDVCVAGPRQNLGYLFDAKPASSLTRVGTLATFDLGVAHDLTVGQGVRIAGAMVGGIPSALFDGSFPIKSVGTTSFTYEMTGVPPGHADASPASTVQAAAQVSRCVLENNVIDLALSRPGYWGRPTGILYTISRPELLASMPHFFRQVVVRENMIRQLALPLDSEHFGITIFSAERLIVENNVIEVGEPKSIQFEKSAAQKFFNNQNPGGTLIQGYDRTTERNQGELATAIEDALVLSL